MYLALRGSIVIRNVVVKPLNMCAKPKQCKEVSTVYSFSLVSFVLAPKNITKYCVITTIVALFYATTLLIDQVTPSTWFIRRRGFAQLIVECKCIMILDEKQLWSITHFNALISIYHLAWFIVILLSLMEFGCSSAMFWQSPCWVLVGVRYCCKHP